MRLKALTRNLIAVAATIAFVLPMATTARAGETVSVVGFGDSLMAGYQLPDADSFPSQLQAALRGKGYAVSITDAGVSGDTTSDGLARLDWSIPDGTDAVILEFGANDALRGISPKTTRANLDAMIGRLKERGMSVLLAGMLAPPNMGEAYASQFNPIYADLAEKHDVPLYPFFLDGVATHADLSLSDGMHPNAEGVATMVERILPDAERLLMNAGAAPKAGSAAPAGE